MPHPRVKIFIEFEMATFPGELPVDTGMRRFGFRADLLSTNDFAMLSLFEDALFNVRKTLEKEFPGYVQEQEAEHKRRLKERKRSA